MDHRIEITLSARKYRTTYQGERIGEFRVLECDAARWLKADRGAVDLRDPDHLPQRSTGNARINRLARRSHRRRE